GVDDGLFLWAELVGLGGSDLDAGWIWVNIRGGVRKVGPGNPLGLFLDASENLRFQLHVDVMMEMGHFDFLPPRADWKEPP
ncbi:MAG: hypothetical protein P1V35_11230, partial [Planctomycetota bacterium]|nr:hypothetical protein [Planctomycetota bacterium]